jgi:DNA (cytosine-5)-methyltransferase 1
MTRAFLELFAGGGMARLGFGPEWRCLFANDIDSKKGAAYRANFGGDELRVCDAGRLTTEGLVAEGRAPRTVVLENVTGLLQSHGGRDIALIHEAFERAGYQHATAVIDARHFVPQSRERVFVIGVRRDMGVSVNTLVDRALSALPTRNLDLIDILENGPHLERRPPEEAERHLAMMSATNLAKVEEARAAGRLIAGAFYRRIRRLPDGTKIQRAEVRFDGLAGALRVASTGGSSTQFLLLVDGPSAQMRPMTPREYARCTGVPESYALSANAGEARSLMGDGVVVPVVRHIVERIIEPALSRLERGR